MAQPTGGGRAEYLGAPDRVWRRPHRHRSPGHGCTACRRPPSQRPPNDAPRCLPPTRSVSATKVAAPVCPTAQTRCSNRVRRPGPPQRTGHRCGSRASPDATGTSPAPPAPDGGPGDRKTNGSVPRQSRREAEPQRCLTGWFAALSRRTGVSRDQPLGQSRVQRGAWRQRGWGLALPGPAGEWAKKRCPNAQLAQRRSLSRAVTCRGAAHPTVDRTDRQSSRSIYH